MLYLIGLGLGDPEDITVKGLNIIKKAKRVLLESYTSVLYDESKLEAFYGRQVERLDRDAVENDDKTNEFLDDAQTDDVAFLVVGDPLGATTHADLLLRAKKRNISYSVIHNASILTAVGCCGLQLYSLGETVSIVMWTDDWQPDSYFDKIEENASRGLHTLCLLDIKMKERTIENLMRNRPVYEPPRFLTASQAAKQLLTIIERRTENGRTLVVNRNSRCVGLARVGSPEQNIVYTTLEEMINIDLGPPLHSLVVIGSAPMHPIEEEMLEMFRPLSITGSEH
ncbi:diphthine synthase [Chamberlinius hualienensis]